MTNKRAATGENLPACEPLPDVDGGARPPGQPSLRERAERRSQETPDALPEKLEALSPEALRASLHDLHVHQIELEMQNEELRRVQAELDASRARYFDLYDLAPVGYLIVSEAGLILQANLTAATLVGLDRSALAKQPFSGLLFKEDRDIYYKHRQQLLKTGEPQQCELRMLKSDGTTFFGILRATAALADDSAPVIRLTVSDITPRQRISAVLQARVKISEYSLDHSLGELLTLTLDETESLTGSTIGFLHFVEPDQLTLSLQEWSTNTLRRMCTSEGKGQHYPVGKAGVWADALRERRPVIHNDYASLPHRKGMPPGHSHVVRMLVVPILRNDQVVALLGVGNKPGDYDSEDIEITSQIASLSWDIAERKMAQEELLRKNAELKRFTYTVSHDLKSPLVTIKTFLGYLVDDLKTNNQESTDKDLGYIHSAADKMERLLNDLLDYARVGHLQDTLQDVSFQEIVGEALELVAGQIASKKVQVAVASEPVWLYGNRRRLVEIFQNLVDNAVKFMGDQPAPRIEIGAEQEGGEIFLFVRDNGMGIDLRHQSKLFGLFEKLDPHSPGSGMGLAIARRIVEAHGGKILARSDGPGLGATFRFTLAKTQLRRAS